MSVAINLPGYIDALTLLGDENRMRLCALLRDRELCVTDLVRVTGIAQSRVSTHLGRLREAGFVRDRRKGSQSFYGLVADSLPAAARTCLDEIAALRRPDAGGGSRSVCASSTPSGAATARARRRRARARLFARPHLAVARGRHRGAAAPRGCPGRRLGRRRRGGCAGALLPLAHLHRHQRAPDRRRRASASVITPTCARQVADVHALPFEDASFDSVLVFHTLTYAEHPARALEGMRARPPPGRAPRRSSASTSTSSARSPPATASGTPASRRAPCAACSRAPA